MPYTSPQYFQNAGDTDERPASNLESKILLGTLKISADMKAHDYESSSVLIFRTTTGIQQGPDAFEE